MINIFFFSILYADDTKILAIIRNEQDNILLQEDLYKLENWSKDWLLKFNTDKCKIMHFGGKNPKFEYELDNHILAEILIERDLGIQIENNLKWERQVRVAASKANGVLAQIKNAFSYLDPKCAKLLYTSLVRPHLEYANAVWNPYFVKDIEALEKVQHRATKIPRFSKLSYEERLKKMNLTTLSERRERGDLIAIFKILKGIDQVSWYGPVRQFEPTSRGLKVKLERQLVKRSTARFQFLTNRVVESCWNHLPQDVINATNVNNFKKLLGEHQIKLSKS